MTRRTLQPRARDSYGVCQQCGGITHKGIADPDAPFIAPEEFRKQRCFDEGCLAFDKEGFGWANEVRRRSDERREAQRDLFWRALLGG